jgi:hypothetical protein
MMAVADGLTVTGLERGGIRVTAPSGAAFLVATMTDGRRLAVSVGDRLRVYGGPDGAGEFASSTILRCLPNGAEVEVVDAPARRARWWNSLIPQRDGT